MQQLPWRCQCQAQVSHAMFLMIGEHLMHIFFIRYLILPAVKSGRIYAVDVSDARAPKLHKVLDGEKIAEVRWGEDRSHPYIYLKALVDLGHGSVLSAHLALPGRRKHHGQHDGQGKRRRRGWRLPAAVERSGYTRHICQPAHALRVIDIEPCPSTHKSR